MGTIRIISHESQMFQDRREAGRTLASELSEYRNKGVVVLGIPRGGIIVAAEIARELNAGLDIVISRKLRTPGQEELAMGSLSENGKVFLNENVIRGFGIDATLIEREKEIQAAEIARRSAVIRKVIPKLSVKGKIVIVTDDGVATGATTQAALWAVRQEMPGKLIVAVPVGAEETVRRLAEDADEAICLRTPPFFAAVGQFYRYFDQVGDDEVIQVLEEQQKRRVSVRF
jgi:putative phosphoribosyl transferase